MHAIEILSLDAASSRAIGVMYVLTSPNSFKSHKIFTLWPMVLRIPYNIMCIR
ncbi:unnamed protein product [Brassica rapa subsp. trilocularis]